MTVRLEGYWSEVLEKYDFNRSNLPAGGEELAAWLSDDVASMESAKFWLKVFDAIVSAGDKEGFIGMGNAHNMYFAKGMIFLECEFVEETKVLININEATKMLQAYLIFNEDARRGKGLPPKPLLVEYEAEGQEARAFLPWEDLPLLKIDGLVNDCR